MGGSRQASLKLAAVLALVGIVMVSCATQPGTVTAGARSTQTLPPSSTTTTTTTSPTTSALGFEPMGSSFVNAQVGWVLGESGCLTCAAIEFTANGGIDWSALRSPSVPLGWYGKAPDSVTDIYFADPNNGFLFGPGLEETHDGGRTWSRGNVPSVVKVTSGNGYVFALSESSSELGASLWRSTVGSDTWSSVAIPEPNGIYQLDAQDGTLVLLEVGYTPAETGVSGSGALWESTDGGTSWVQRDVPCLQDEGEAAVMSIALGHPAAWLIDCYNGEQSMQEQDTQHHLYGTSDDGSDWVRLADPTNTGAPELLVDNGSGHAFLATQGGGGDQLDGTVDGGSTWSEHFASGGSFFGWADLQFVDSSAGFVVGPTHYAPEHLYRTVDGGRTWTILQITP